MNRRNPSAGAAGTSMTAETRALLDSIEALGFPPIHEMSPTQARAMREKAARLAPVVRPEPVGRVEDLSLDGPGGPLPVRMYTPDGWDPELGGALLYCHGGGWVLGNLDTHDAPCRGLANASGLRVVAVDYRLAPEHPHPAALEDAWAATCWLDRATHGPLFVGGDSAGGHLATNIAARARASSVSVAGQLLVYPVTDLSRFDTASYDTYAEGYWLTRAAMEWFRGHYLPAGTDRTDPDVSPLLREELSGMPTAVIVTAECDVLRDEGVAYGERLHQAGCEVTHLEYDGVIHGFFAMPDVIPEGRRAMTESGLALKAIAEAA